nr:hydrolase [Actinomycetota bacterium]
VQGDRDSFGAPDSFPETVDLAVIPGADHGFTTLKRGDLSQEEALGVLVEAVLEWITREVA